MKTLSARLLSAVPLSAIELLRGTPRNLHPNLWSVLDCNVSAFSRAVAVFCSCTPSPLRAESVAAGASA